jgi:hypothetical protein
MISERINAVRERIALACQRARRDVSEVTLVAVTKTFPAAMVREAVRAGVSDVGENYVQELLGKRDDCGGDEIRWHFIGHLQTNKVRQIAGWIRMIHAVDSEPLVKEINRRAAEAKRTIDCLIEVNTTGETTKFGVRPDEAGALVRSLAPYEHVRIAGLMTIGPFLPDPEGSRPMFRRLRDLRDEITAAGQTNVALRYLSMGMTGDFEVAIEEGATHIRIGTALFGKRTKA